LITLEGEEDKDYDYTEAEIARRTGLTPKTVSKELEILVNEKILRLTRKIGRSNMYSLNETDNVKGLIQYMDDIIKTAYESLSKA
jgi:DNA-binding transcriptional ArsR family regulator